MLHGVQMQQSSDRAAPPAPQLLDSALGSGPDAWNTHQVHVLSQHGMPLLRVRMRQLAAADATAFHPCTCPPALAA